MTAEEKAQLEGTYGDPRLAEIMQQALGASAKTRLDKLVRAAERHHGKVTSSWTERKTIEVLHVAYQDGSWATFERAPGSEHWGVPVVGAVSPMPEVGRQSRFRTVIRHHTAFASARMVVWERGTGSDRWTRL